MRTMIFKKMVYKVLSMTILVVCASASLAQQHHYVPLYRAVNYPVMNSVDTLGSNFHTAVRPYRTKDLKTDDWYQKTYGSDFFVDHFFLNFTRAIKDSTPVKLAAYPIGSFMAGFETGTNVSETYETSIGFNVSGMLSDVLDVNINFLRSHSRLPLYIENYAFEQGVIPGQGYAYRTDWGYHYRNSTGYVSYNPGEHFNLTLGRGKHFWGDGYRSMMLSDFAFNYDYLKLSADFWKIKYNVMWAYMKDIYNEPEAPNQYNEKYMAFHHLSWNLGKRWNVQFFEAVVWQAQDSLVRRGFDPHYLNPVVFYRPVEFSIGSPDNVLLGVGSSFRLSNRIKAYGQLVLDEFKIDELRSREGWWGNKYGLQMGMKYYDAFKVDGLTLQGEANYVRPYTYSHINSTQAFGHWNEPMAHPSGANLWEGVFLASYFSNRWYFEFKSVYREQGKDAGGTDNNGGNIFAPNSTRNVEYGNEVGQGIRYTTSHTRLFASWLLSSRTNLRAEASMSWWSQDQGGTYKPELFMANMGIRIGLFNQYGDF